MKKNSKIIASILTILMSMLVFSGCGGHTIAYNTKKTQLFIFAYDGGYGQNYLTELGSAFEESVKENSYEEGKKGVEIIYNFSKANATGQSLLSTINNNKNELYFTGMMSPQDIASADVAIDITDIVNEKLDGEDKSIMDKIHPTLKDVYTVGSQNKVLSLPIFDGFHSFYYDVDLLNDNSLWIKADSDDTNISYVGENGLKSKGPDGKLGTYDDGMPDTYSQFYSWCDKMAGIGIIPFTWSGIYQFHFDYALQNFWADFEGKEQMELNYSFNGTAKDIVTGFNGNEPIIGQVLVSEANGDILQKQLGKLKVTEFMKKVADNQAKWINNMSFSGLESHTAAQTTYLTSKFKGREIAMFADGIWWESEATNVFKAYEGYGGGKLNRKFAMLPTPKASREKIGERATIVSSDASVMFIKKGIPANKEKIAKEFIKFMHTNDNLSFQNGVSGITKPFSYTLQESDLKKMSFYAKNMYEIKASSNVDYVYATSDSKLFLNNYNDFHQESWGFYSKFSDDSDTKSRKCIKTFMDNKSLTAKRYFEGYYKTFNDKPAIGNSKWEEMLNKAK